MDRQSQQVQAESSERKILMGNLAVGVSSTGKVETIPKDQPPNNLHDQKSEVSLKSSEMSIDEADEDDLKGEKYKKKNNGVRFEGTMPINNSKLNETSLEGFMAITKDHAQFFKKMADDPTLTISSYSKEKNDRTTKIHLDNLTNDQNKKISFKPGTIFLAGDALSNFRNQVKQYEGANKGSCPTNVRYDIAQKILEDNKHLVSPSNSFVAKLSVATSQDQDQNLKVILTGLKSHLIQKKLSTALVSEQDLQKNEIKALYKKYIMKFGKANTPQDLRSHAGDFSKALLNVTKPRNPFVETSSPIVSSPALKSALKKSVSTNPLAEINQTKNNDVTPTTMIGTTQGNRPHEPGKS